MAGWERASVGALHPWRLLALAAVLAVAAVWPSSPGGVQAVSPPAELISTFDGIVPLPSRDQAASISGDGSVVVFTTHTPIPGGGGTTTSTTTTTTTAALPKPVIVLKEVGVQQPAFATKGVAAEAAAAITPQLLLEVDTEQVVVRDRATGSTVVVPQPTDVAAGNTPYETDHGAVSRDGCHVAYWVDVPFESSGWKVYSWDRCDPSLPPPVRVSVEDDFESPGPIAVSADGRFVAYAGKPDGRRRVVRHDLSNPGDDKLFDGGLDVPDYGDGSIDTSDDGSIDISDDGSFVVVDGEELDLDDEEQELRFGVVYGWSPDTGERTRITAITDGSTQPDGTAAFDPSVSADGRFVAFSSNEQFGEFDWPQVYVFDRFGPTVRQLTGVPGAPQPSDGGADADINADGTQVAFTNYVPLNCDCNDAPFVHVARSTAGIFDAVAYELVGFGTDDAPVVSSRPAISDTGRFVAFESIDGRRLGGTSTSSGLDVWLRERPASLSATGTIDFGPVTIGSSVGPQPITVTNDSNVIVPIDGIGAPGGPFAIVTDGCSGIDLPPGASCFVTVSFTPGAAGAASGSVIVTGVGADATTQVVGLGLTPGALILTPASNDFGSGPLGTAFPAAPFIVTNTGGSPVGVATVGIVGVAVDQFSLGPDGCSGRILASGTNCSIEVSALVTREGTQTADLQVSGTNGQVLSAALRVTGDPPPVVVTTTSTTTSTTTTPPATPPPGVLSLTPASADLGSAQVGSPVAAVVFTAQNTGGQAFTVSNVSIGGSGASQFAVTVNGCLNRVLAPSASCQITVGATPTQVLVSNATLTATGSSGQSDSSTLRVEGTLKLFNPTLVMNPGVARPGQVTTAVGAGFPPGAVVQLAVAGGLPFATVTADANGDLRGSLLILRNSPLVGGFEVIAVDQPEFSGVRAPLLIDLASFQPSGSNDAGFANGLRVLYGRGG